MKLRFRKKPDHIIKIPEGFSRRDAEVYIAGWKAGRSWTEEPVEKHFSNWSPPDLGHTEMRETARPKVVEE